MRLCSVHEIMRTGYYSICKTKIRRHGLKTLTGWISIKNISKIFFGKLNVKLDHKEKVKDKMNDITKIITEMLAAKIIFNYGSLFRQ